MPHQRLLIGHLLYKVLSFRCISLRSICSGRSLFLIGEDEYVGQSLLDGSDASGVAAFDDVFDLFGKYQYLLLYDLTILMTLTVMLWSMNASTSRSSISMSHSTFRISFCPFSAAGVFDDSNGAV